MFHKGVSDLIYADMTKEVLAQIKSQQRVVKLETQLKKENATNKAWKLNVKLLHDQVVDLTAWNALQEPLASEQPVATEKTILPGKPLAMIQAYKREARHL